jgi:sulfate-transporting ATPase
MILSVDKLSKSYGARVLFKDAALRINERDRYALVGPNGAGKTTLLNIIAGTDAPDEGTVVFARNAEVGYLEQTAIEVAGEAQLTVLDAVLAAAADLLNIQARLTHLEQQITDAATDGDDEQTQQRLLDEYGRLSDAFAHGGGYTIEPLARSVLFGLGFKEGDLSRLTGEFSGGWQMRIALAKLLLRKPDLLLLDEPTNHLDAESVEWLEQYLCRFPGTVVAVTHDRYFLDNAAEWILELDRGCGIPGKGNYSSWLEQKEARLEAEQKQLDAHRRAMRQELAWVRSNPRARQAKSRARLARFEEMSSYEYQARNETQEIFIPVAERLGDKVIEFTEVSKGFGDRLLIDRLSFTVPPGAIVGIIGPNGAGKSTLFRMITGAESPDGGVIDVGPTVRMAYVDQSRENLSDEKTVFDELAEGRDILSIGKFEMPSRAYIGRFNFKGADQQKIVGRLSGGERGRLHLARTLMTGGNLLLLDEPSNDLDVETLRALEDALIEFAGCALIISHDRWFLDRVCTHILACEGESQWRFFAGNYQEYEEDKKKRLGEEGARPKRIRYKPIRR